ncbi:MAG: hypothetical protein HYR88_00230, partial [Verrucomicrobia bacterium]|nr:hypothetical protein [Verrucomicrobiota bacterium]
MSKQPSASMPAPMETSNPATRQSSAPTRAPVRGLIYLLTILWVSWLGSTLAGQASGPVYLTDEQIWTTGDVDGDGNTDVVLVDHEPGLITLGRGRIDGNYDWLGPFASGLPGITSIALDRFELSSRDSLVLVSPEANRVARWRWNPASPSQPDLDQIPIPGLGPTWSSSGRSGPTAADLIHVAIISTLNNPPAGDHLHVLR